MFKKQVLGLIKKLTFSAQQKQQTRFLKKSCLVSMNTLQGINISHLGKRKIIFKMAFLGDMLGSWRVCLHTWNLTHTIHGTGIISLHGWCWIIVGKYSSPMDAMGKEKISPKIVGKRCSCGELKNSIDQFTWFKIEFPPTIFWRLNWFCVSTSLRKFWTPARCGSYTRIQDATVFHVFSTEKEIGQFWSCVYNSTRNFNPIQVHVLYLPYKSAINVGKSTSPMDMGMIINEWEAANSNNVFRLPASRLNPCASAFTKKRFRLQQKRRLLLLQIYDV